MISDNFAAFILSHRRPDRVLTHDTLRDCGYTGPIYIVCDDEDPTLDEYVRRFGEDRVLVFSKVRYEDDVDYCVNEHDHSSVVYARQAVWDFADEIGVEHFVELDDDYSQFAHRWNASGEYGWYPVQSLDFVFEAMVGFLEHSGAKTIAMSQGGDHIGGACPQRAIELKRKAMNVFVCATDNPFDFRSKMNDDVSTYVVESQRGHLFFTFIGLHVDQRETQQADGGLTDIYLSCGTYQKSFMSVMQAPSNVKVTTMGPREKRIHHRVDWRHTAPKILGEEHRKLGKRSKAAQTKSHHMRGRG